MEHKENLKKYAELVIKAGCNVQPGQDLLVSADISSAEFTRLVVEQAYLAGARQVTVLWSDDQVARLGYEYSPLEVYEHFPEWAAMLQNTMAEKGAAILYIDSSDPGCFAGIDPRKPAASSKAAHVACKSFYDAMELGKIVWCIVAAASPDWARKVYPELPGEQALDQLWASILKAVRADLPDPVQAWEDHKKSFQTKRALLNRCQFASLHYKNALGTDITIGLPENHEWAGGGGETVEGRYFFPNMPTEEIFCTPHKDKADGTVCSSLPLNYHGNLIEDIKITFQNGRITDFSAAKGYDVLKELIGTDEGSHHLGEAALIPKLSPISQMDTIFFNTLYDENASCHFAFGRGFAECVKDGYTLTSEQLAAAGVNESAAHVDFMLGTDDLAVTGIRKDGTELSIFENGNWSADFLAEVEKL